MREDFKKQLRGGPKHAKLLRVADPKRRIFVLVGLLVLLSFMAAMLHGYSQREQSKGPQTEAPPSQAMPREPTFRGVPTLDRSYVAKVADRTEEERGRWDEEPIEYLLLEAHNTPAIQKYRQGLLPITPGSAAEIERDPEPWRFQFVRFRGKLEYIREGDYADLFAGSDDIGRVHHGRVLIQGGPRPLRVKFVTPTMPTAKDWNASVVAPPTEMIRDGWVRGRGIFVKRYLDVGPDGEEVPALLVVAMKIIRDFETRPVPSLESIPFQIIADHSGLLNDKERRKLLFKLYPKTLFRLLRWATPRAGEAGRALREKEGLQPISMKPIEVYEEIVSNPARFRTRYMGAKGALVYTPLRVGPDQIEDDMVNDAGINSYVTGWIVTDKDRLIQFAAPDSLGKGLKKRARIRFAGYFYKTQGYFATGGTERLTPFLVLTELEEIPIPPPDRRLDLMIAAGFILGISLLVFIIVREDKTKRDYRRLRRKKAT